MYQFVVNPSAAETMLLAHKAEETCISDYVFSKLSFPNVSIPNRTLALTLASKEESSTEVCSLKSAIEDYNKYVDFLNSIPGFHDYFVQHTLCVNKDEVTKTWTQEIADRVFSLKAYCFETDLSVRKQFLYDSSRATEYYVDVDGNTIYLPVGSNSDAYPKTCDKKSVIWNWTENGHDFCFFLWSILGERYNKAGNYEDDDDVEVTYPFDAYDQFRGEAPEPQLIRIFNRLEKLGYIKSFTIRPEYEDPLWYQFGKTDGSIDMAFIDKSFLKNKLVMEQIELLLWTPSDEITSKHFFLTDSNNRQYLCSEPGTIGGHCKLKIYGRLDCPSALRYLENGEYKQNRVFFSDVDTATKAGYRPCAKCMRAQYLEWKAQNP